jgi:hypothetical protein
LDAGRQPGHGARVTFILINFWRAQRLRLPNRDPFFA